VVVAEQVEVPLAVVELALDIKIILLLRREVRIPLFPVLMALLAVLVVTRTSAPRLL
jgi:hypothetical protein